MDSVPSALFGGGISWRKLPHSQSCLLPETASHLMIDWHLSIKTWLPCPNLRNSGGPSRLQISLWGRWKPLLVLRCTVTPPSASFPCFYRLCPQALHLAIFLLRNPADDSFSDLFMPPPFFSATLLLSDFLSILFVGPFPVYSLFSFTHALFFHLNIDLK